jgi:hypothetical protein
VFYSIPGQIEGLLLVTPGRKAAPRHNESRVIDLLMRVCPVSVFQDNNSFLQAKFHHHLIRHMPDFSLSIPDSSNLFEPSLYLAFIGCDVKRDKGFSGKTTLPRKPRHFFLDQFNGFDSPFPTRVIAISDIHKLIAIFLDQFFGALLSWPKR